MCACKARARHQPDAHQLSNAALAAAIAPSAASRRRDASARLFFSARSDSITAGVCGASGVLFQPTKVSPASARAARIAAASEWSARVRT